ncbi:MAG: ATP-binding protein, partial [Vicinamibacteria bacterium]
AEELQELVENDLALMLTERFTAAALTEDADTTVESDAPPQWLAPIERDELIGRTGPLAEITDLLQRADVGLVTLTGPGGSGKSRLGVHVANTLGASFPDGIFYVALAGLRDVRDVVPVIVSTLEIPSPPSGSDPERLLLGFLRSRRALLVLDNFEHVIEAAAVVPRLLDACPHLKVLVTSREALRIRGEREFPVPPLPHEPSNMGGERTPAMALFEERAREVRPDFRIDDENRAAVAELLRRLDALPLAIELAAARVRVLSPQAMLPRLDQSLSLLSGGKRDLPERHQGLRATIDWSVDLLRPEEQVLFRRLGVFGDSFSEEAAEAVVADAGVETLDGLTSLVEKNLLVRTETRGEARFHMLETVRQMARERAADSGEERAASLRQAEWLEGYLAREHKDLLKADRRQAAQERIALEIAGARPALRFAAGPDGDAELAWRLYIHVVFSLQSSAQTAEALAMREIISSLPRSRDSLRAAIADGMWAWSRAAAWDETAEPLLASAATALEALGDRDFLTGIVTARGMIAGLQDPASALAVLAHAVELASEGGHTWIEGWARCMIVYTHVMAGALDDARRAADEAILISRRQRNDEGAAFALSTSAFVNLRRGDLAASRAQFAEAVALAQARSAMWPRCIALTGLCSVTVAAGDHARGRALLEESLHYSTGVEYVAVDVVCGTIALMLAREGERERALRVFTAVRAGAEDETSFTAQLSDPSGALRNATREARRLLGDPPPVDPETLDLASVVQAALGVPDLRGIRPGMP